MRKKMILSLIVVFYLLLFVQSLYALDISGWWKVNLRVKEGDFQTGEWISYQTVGKEASYLYVFSSPPPFGSAVLLIYSAGGYIREPLEGAYAAYIWNNIIVFALSGATIILKPLGSSYLPHMMKGYYTAYDTEAEVTPDQFVRMGSVSATRVSPEKVPEEAQKEVPPP